MFVLFLFFFLCLFFFVEYKEFNPKLFFFVIPGNISKHKEKRLQVKGKKGIADNQT